MRHGSESSRDDSQSILIRELVEIRPTPRAAIPATAAEEKAEDPAGEFAVALTFGTARTADRRQGILADMSRKPSHLCLRYAVLGLAAGLWAQVHAAPFDVPALANPPNTIHQVGKLVWLDLETTDLPGAKHFYGDLFGWSYRDYHADGVDYTVALVDDHPVAGLVRRSIVNDAERRSAWLPFFSVLDVDQTVRLALKADAHVRSAPEDLPLRGRQARMTDPESAVFALENSSSGDPPDDPNPRAIGTWGSPALLARDPAHEGVFYQRVLKYTVVGQPADGGFERIRLSSGTHERANVRLLPAGIATPHAEWISFVRVFSTADTARQAVKLGGRILVGPTREAHGATSTILEDPTGAVFGVIELPPEVVKIESP
jgi:predicted enzyme related to lactoylglutathione lyase